MENVLLLKEKTIYGWELKKSWEVRFVLLFYILFLKNLLILVMHFLQGKAGWREAVSPHDRWLQTILNNVVYYLNEAPDPTQNESDYCLPCEDDKATTLL